MTLRTENGPLKRPLARSHAHGGGFKHFFFPALPGERDDPIFTHMFSKRVETTNK